MAGFFVHSIAKYAAHPEQVLPEFRFPDPCEPNPKPALIERQQSPAPTTPFLPEIWPRLEEGALICKSRDDLVRYQTQIANGSSTTPPGQAPDCHTVRKQTGIQILAHDGPSRTQIVTTDESKETWWTNSYLPSTPPPSVAKGPAAGK